MISVSSEGLLSWSVLLIQFNKGINSSFSPLMDTDEYLFGFVLDDMNIL